MYTCERSRINVDAHVYVDVVHELVGLVIVVRVRIDFEVEIRVVHVLVVLPVLVVAAVDDDVSQCDDGDEIVK